MDRRQDSNVASTPAETSGLSSQDCYCARSSGGGAQKQRGNGDEWFDLTQGVLFGTFFIAVLNKCHYDH